MLNRLGKFQRWIQAGTLVAISLYLCACTSTSISHPNSTETSTKISDSSATTSPMLLLPPQDFGITGLVLPSQLTQHIVVKHGSSEDTFDALLEIDSKALKMAAIKFGHRIITLSYDGAELQTQVDAMVPKAVDPKRILSDVQMVYWSLEAINRALPTGYTMTEQALIGHTQRQLKRGDQVLIEIDYAEGQHPWQNVSLTHHLYHYSMQIHSKLSS